jgi:tRNA A-37 threonylcarbamoyl transferase component Bud32
MLHFVGNSVDEGPGMWIHPRAIRGATLCVLWLLSVSARVAGAAGSAGTSSPLSRFLSPLEPWIEPVLALWRDAVVRSPELARFDRFATSPLGIGVLVGLAVALWVGLVTIRLVRGTGQLNLRLAFPDEVEGEFEVALHRKSTRRPGNRAGAAPRVATRKRRRTSRSGVRRETQFEGLAPGRWFVTIDGTLTAPDSVALLATISEEIEVRVTARSCERVDFALPAVEAPVELRIQWDRQPARDVGMGVARTRLPLGRHTFLVGAGDRVVEHELPIADYEPKFVAIDVAGAAGLVFKGCPPAVSSYLQGDLGNAARALERDGQSDVAHLLFAQLHQELGQTERAAEQLENAGRTREAAELRRSISDFGRAGTLYENAGELRCAAEMYDAAESWAEAARIYAILEDWPNAARCFECAGEIERLIEALEAQGELFRAAALASERDDRALSIRLLQKIAPGHPDHGRACELLALAFEQEGHLDLAARQLELRLESLAPGETASQLELHLAELLAETDEWARALSVLEALRNHDPTYPNVASRIETLRKKLSAPLPQDTATAFTPPPGATAFVAEERYEILQEIGRGGMGLVYKARDRRLGRDVALKRMPESLREHSGAVSLFLGEAQAAARMNHPNIVTLYDADQKQGHFFITMELLEGLPLNTILKQHGRFGPRDTARLGLQICAGLHYAHAQGIVHRDIKTANLFITREKVLKIMDFGLAKIMEAVRDKGATVIAGTPFYMAPEQSAGCVVDGRTDLYALGVTLFELSTGKLPFAEGDVAEQHRNAPPPDPTSICSGYPSSLAQLIQHLMAKSPEDRPANALAVAEILKPIIENSSS